MTTTRKTPVRAALRDASPLRASVQEGMGAVERAHHVHFDTAIRSDFADSLDIDEGLKRGREQENRWDYLLGHRASGHLVAVEPHSAKDDEIERVIRKRTAAREQLREHLRDGANVSKWLWVASGKVRFAGTEKARRRLDQHGIECVGTTVKAKHLPTATDTSQARSRRRA